VHKVAVRHSLSHLTNVKGSLIRFHKLNRIIQFNRVQETDGK
jgi:hypothetical protein